VTGETNSAGVLRWTMSPLLDGPAIMQKQFITVQFFPERLFEISVWILAKKSSFADEVKFSRIERQSEQSTLHDG